MKTQQWLWTAVLVIGAVALYAGLTATAQNAARPAKPTSIAVVDLQAVLEALAEKRDLEAELQGKADTFTKEGQDREQKIKDLKGDLDILAEGAAKAAKIEELEFKLLEHQTWREFQRQKLLRENALQMESMYRKIVDASGRTAQESSYDLVLFKEAAPNFRGIKDTRELSAIVQMRKVLWSAPELDLTQQVIAKMNNEYKNKGKAGATAPAAR